MAIRGSLINLIGSVSLDPCHSVRRRIVVVDWGFFIAAINHSKLYKEIKCIALLKIDIYIQINLVNFPRLRKKNIHKCSRKTWIFIDICIKNDVYIIIRIEHLHLNVELKNSCVILSTKHPTTSNYASLRIRALWGNKSVFFLHDIWSRDL